MLKRSTTDTENAVPEAKKRQAEAKALRRERKLQKTHGAEVEELKRVWERLRAKTGVTTEERAELVAQCVELAKGKWSEVVFRHDASRVVQTIFKYANDEQRAEITTALRGSYLPLAKSSYGKYLLVNMARVGNAEVRARVLAELRGHCSKLLRSADGAYVLNELYMLYATSAQRRTIMSEFFGPEFALLRGGAADAPKNLKDVLASAGSTDKQRFILGNLFQAIKTALRKNLHGLELLHAMMLEFLLNAPHAQQLELVDLIADEVVELVHTKFGSRAASLLLAVATAKERKRMLKSLRQYPFELASNEFGNTVLMAAFLTVDDVKHLKKAFEPVFEQLVDLATNKFARRPLLLLLVGPTNKKYFADMQQRFDEIKEAKQHTSKKEDDARLHELLQAFLPTISDQVIAGARALAANSLGSQVLLELLLNKDVQGSDKFNAIVEAVATAFQVPEGKKLEADAGHPLVANPFGGRFAKMLVHKLPEFRKPFLAIVSEDAESFATGEGCFAVVALVEETHDKALLKALRRHRRAIEQSDARGRDVLLGLI